MVIRIFSGLILVWGIAFSQATDRLDSLQVEAQANFVEADSLAKIYEYSEAEQNYYTALNLFRQTEDSLDMAECYLKLAKINFAQGYYSKSDILLDSAIPVLEQHGETDRLFESHYMRGEIRSKRGLFDEAVASFSKAEGIAKTADRTAQVFKAIMALGNLSHLRERYEGAINNFGRALAIAPDRADSGLVYINIADVYAAQGDSAKAQGYLKMGEEYAQGDTAILVEVYNSKSNHYLDKGDYLRALEYLAKELELIKAGEDLYTRAKVMMNMAMIYEIQGQYGKAADFMEEVVRIFNKLNSPEALRAKGMLEKLKGK